MAPKKKNVKCPLQDDCEKKCEYIGNEWSCVYFRTNCIPEVEKEAIRNGIYIPKQVEEIDWDAVLDFEELEDEEDEEDEGKPVAEFVQTSGRNEEDEELLPVITVDDSKILYLSGDRGYTAKISEAINRTKQEFLYIGMLLCEVEDYGYYSEGGFADVYEYCEVAFGFKRSSTNNFMRVYRKFGQAMGLQEEYREYGYSQLTEMCSMNDIQLAQCNPGMSVKKLREIKKPVSIGCDTLGCVEEETNPVQTSGLEIHDNRCSYQIPVWLSSKIIRYTDSSSKAVFDALDAGLEKLYGCKLGYDLKASDGRQGTDSQECK